MLGKHPSMSALPPDIINVIHHLTMPILMLRRTFILQKIVFNLFIFLCKLQKCCNFSVAAEKTLEKAPGRKKYRKISDIAVISVDEVEPIDLN